MKIISKNLIKLHTYDEEGLTTFQGSIRVEPEDEEDIYQLYNILMEGDNLEAMTLRNVSFETSSGKGEKQKVLVSYPYYFSFFSFITIFIYFLN